MKSMSIEIKTLTPIWTGGVNGECDILHETGIIGSMRWWYEAIVRGLGGYACDPTKESCKFDTKSYEKALRKGKGTENALEVGLKEVCPACYLFGCTGLKRLFQLQIENSPTSPLHFRTPVKMNQNWLTKIFGGESERIDNLDVFYGNLKFRFVFRGNDTDIADFFISQLLMLFQFISKYGSLGAKPQHGFGQVEIFDAKSSIDDSLNGGLKGLYELINSDKFKSVQNVEISYIPYDLQNFICLNYDLPKNLLKMFTQRDSHIGNNSKSSEDKYLPCVFDIRYKGKNKGKIGMRRWLKKDKDWTESDDPKQMGQIDQLLGPRSKWKLNGKDETIDEKCRTASRLCFGMPYKIDNEKYRLRIFGFAPPSLEVTDKKMTPDILSAYCQEYMQHAFNSVKPTNVISGKEIIERMEAKNK
ncbi:MAG: type III-B CRISPR module RAMP protein Cmr1 [ANME-2 cluster archaeon]|nr:MAG: type III-B CRISPR module RAMP protein Cmr1 [ANME-2 cluster archaeon]